MPGSDLDEEALILLDEEATILLADEESIMLLDDEPIMLLDDILEDMELINPDEDPTNIDDDIPAFIDGEPPLLPIWDLKE
jgi:hypothetical protein